MGTQRLYIKSNKTLAGVQFDAVIEEGHASTVKVTKNPIELGSEVSDHAVIEPKILTIVAEVSDNPIFNIDAGPVFTDNDSFGSSTSSNLTRSVSAYQTLIAFQELRELVEVQTRLKNYTNMLITSIIVTQDKDSSKIISLSIQMDEMIIVESETVDIPATQLESGSATEQATSADNRGKQETVEPVPSVEKSVGKTVADWVAS